MNKEKAILMLHAGKKIRHELFADHEYIMMDKDHPDENYIDEDGVVLGIRDFWFWRKDTIWDHSWSIHE